jgi:hypothetical protein
MDCGRGALRGGHQREVDLPQDSEPSFFWVVGCYLLNMVCQIVMFSVKKV